MHTERLNTTQCDELQQQVNNDATVILTRLKIEGSTMTVVCGRQGRSVRGTGLGDIIYRHGWLVNNGQGMGGVGVKPSRTGSGTLIKEMMGLQPTTGSAELVMQQAMIADGTTRLHVEGHGVVGRKQGFGTLSRDRSKKENLAHR